MMTVGGNDRVMLAAQHIVKSLGTTTSATKDMIMILSNFDSRLEMISEFMASEHAKRIEQCLEGAETRIMQWDLDSAVGRKYCLWGDYPEEARDFLHAVDEVLDLMESLEEGTLENDAEKEILERAEKVVHVAMVRLEDEFQQVLIRNAVPLNVDLLIIDIPVCGENKVESESSKCVDHDSDSNDDADVVDGVNESITAFELIRSEAIPDFRDIAHRMIRSGYLKECCHVYCSARREALEECLWILGVDKLSIDDVQRMEWGALDAKIGRWIKAFKVAIGGIISYERCLCEQIFGKLFKNVRNECFVEIVKGRVFQLLNFGEAVAIGQRSPQKLFRILDMYDALSGILPEICLLFAGEAEDLIVRDAQGLLASLAEATKGTLIEFENVIQNETSKPPSRGDIYPLVQLVMNYLQSFDHYQGTLNLLMESMRNDVAKEEDDEIKYLGSNSPIARRLFSWTSLLEENLVEKSKLFKDEAMQYIFLMNNILYIVQQVKGSKLIALLGDRWVKKRRGQVRQYANCYLRSAWNKVLSCLRDEGIGSASGRFLSSGSVSRVVLKECFQKFNMGFEEIYRNQTAWNVPDAQLREDLRFSISEKVIPAYRSFIGRFSIHLESARHPDKYMKFTPEDLENYLLDFFEGTPATLNHPRRKSSS